MPPNTETRQAYLEATSGENDRRHPLYLGDWMRSIPYIDEDIAVDDLDEPHFKRKSTILQSHPEIEKLYGYEWRTIPITILAAAVQIAIAYLFGRILVNWHWTMLFVAYFVGGFFTGLYGVLIHEVTHGLVGPSPLLNRVMGLIANIGLPVPIAMSFRRYHLEHHTFQGVIGRDPDLPLEWERFLIRGNALFKLLWVLIYPVMYVVRGAVQQKVPQKWEVINLLFTVATDYLVFRYCGLRGLLYLFLSLWMGYSLHPAAAHFIQEHYTFDDGQETYSYYGGLNWFFLNIGYHNEHHDFTKIPWSRLPNVRQLAPEYYDTLAYHTSWIRVLWNFIVDPTLGPQSRLGRSLEDHKKGRKMTSHHLKPSKK
ncbi:uncharacterized protein VTP21DRAFT_6301 [Calcarisporiella thermophila]|uniref:uncharacterized protein n=1 Tax=Calcarisporiella thermophila TaxID=911321 RepID=UPI00374315B8